MVVVGLWFMVVHQTVNVQMSVMTATNAEQIRRIGFVIAHAIAMHVIKVRIVVQTIATMVFVHLAVHKGWYVRTAQCVPLVLNVSRGETASIILDIVMLLHSVSTDAIKVFREC